MKYEHPLRDEIKPVLPADFVSDDVGTGLVHTAPSHGPDDYQLALRYNIPVVSISMVVLKVEFLWGYTNL